ncbi:MAG TPA: FKBP-type peptidyl-prolyl cis-trans isomerase [Candidatus Nanoarchaeia archaeon]|nr:FKBP-type peptidyl-prolyl cis-trans isomerase [Candidatus Nanoarchaeia archaeon]
MKTRLSLVILITVIAVSIFSAGGIKQTVLTGDNVTVEYTPVTSLFAFNKSITSFVVGSNEVIKGLEIGVIGMRVGEEKQLMIPPAMAFGDYDTNKIYELPSTFFTDRGFNIPTVGTKVNLNEQNGIVVEIIDDNIIVDTNNALAGETINMTIKVISINNH